jgi:hypothetical protein
MSMNDDQKIQINEDKDEQVQKKKRQKRRT